MRVKYRELDRKEYLKERSRQWLGRKRDKWKEEWTDKEKKKIICSTSRVPWTNDGMHSETIFRYFERSHADGWVHFVERCPERWWNWSICCLPPCAANHLVTVSVTDGDSCSAACALRGTPHQSSFPSPSCLLGRHIQRHVKLPWL
jgi:hypothetical protein